jgi:NAD(P)H-quinone oxidoreductase subunit 5
MATPDSMTILAALTAVLPFTYAAGTALAGRVAPVERARRATGVVAGAGLFLALAALAAAGYGWLQGDFGPGVVVPASGPLRIDVLTLAMVALIASITWAIARYSLSYLAGEAAELQFGRWLFAVAGSVCVLVSADHLLMLWAAWVSTSLCLHQLLVFYPERRSAVLAAHKKFLLSRLADLSLLVAFVLLAGHFGSFSLGAILGGVGALEALPADLVAAAVLVCVAAIMKTAQLPFHGWLLQVMEAPTPVSALLHAGVVNIGGFLLIRLAPLVALAPAAQVLLVVFGSVTAVVAGLVMTTRVSVKVGLAWSTCAQMGLMLLECGLGAWSVALLHLLAHSFYKAYSFLSAGRTVERHVQVRMTRPMPAGGWAPWGFGLAAGAGLASLGALAAGLDVAAEPALPALVAVLAVGAATLLAEAAARRDTAAMAAGAGGAVLLSVLYFTWHHVFAGLGVAASTAVAPALVGWVVVAFALQYLTLAAVRVHPQARLVRALQVRLFHGLYLDEVFTRATFALWPPRLPSDSAAAAAPSPVVQFATLSHEEVVA